MEKKDKINLALCMLGVIIGGGLIAYGIIHNSLFVLMISAVVVVFSVVNFIEVWKSC